MKKSDVVNRKFISTINLDDIEILTDSGFVDVISLHTTIPYTKYYIKTDNNFELYCADKHIVFDSELNEVFVDELHVGDKIITEQGVSVITDIINCECEENMYDLELCENSNHRYYTNGILSHNTFLIQNIAKMLGVPCHIHDCTKLTQAGYVGEDVENILTGLLQACDYDIERAQVGIVCLDEIDKIAIKGENVSITRDVSGEGVQQSLLKIVEGSVVGVMPQGGRKHPEQSLIPVDTTNILFIGMGAFVGLDKIVEKRISTTKNKSIGFTTSINDNNDIDEPDNILDDVTPIDLKKFGIIPELVGRFPVITHTNPLEKKDLIRIISEPKNAIMRQYQKLAAIDGKTLKFTSGAIDTIAEAAIITDTGARGLRGILETVLTDFMFEAADSDKDELVVDKKYCEKSLKRMLKLASAGDKNKKAA